MKTKEEVFTGFKFPGIPAIFLNILLLAAILKRHFTDEKQI